MFQQQVKLTDIIAPSFYEVHKDIKAEGHSYYDLYGGRGSTKSSFISAEIVLGMMQDKDANAIVFRKYGTTLRESVFEQIAWAIDALGVNHLWMARLNPLSFIYLPTGQRIIFRGLDKAKKTKSIKVARGYFKYLWFEELDEFAGIEEIRTTQQSVLRGGDKFIIFKSFNPPISRSNWANEYVAEKRDDSFRHKSDYTTVPPEWLGERFIADAEHLKATNERAYQHEYMGEPVGLGTNVFEFLEFRTITDDEIARMDRIYQGQDWGYYPDPLAFVRLYYDKARETIYLVDELVENRWSNRRAADWILSKGYQDYEIICDSAEPKSVNDFRDFGLPARQAVKGAGSVEYGMKWLQTRTIVIDRERTPRAYKEFKEYEFEVDRSGNVLSAYPDKDNHTIDACRYALERFYNKRGVSA